MVFRVQANNHPLTHLPSSSPFLFATSFSLDLVLTSSYSFSSATHTCFNLLSLPRYRSRSALNKKLVEAVGMSSGFGLK